MDKDLKDKEYVLEQETKSEADKKIEAQELPVYMERLELTEEQEKRLVQEFKAEMTVIKEQRENDKLESKWEALQNQYDGVIEEDARKQFNLNMRITKVKVDKCVNLIMQSFFESDPIYAVSPRPEYEKEGGRPTCNKQQDFLDYKLDNLPFRFPIGLTVHSATVKGTGILKLYHEIRRETKRREETYDGKPVPMADSKNQTIMKNGMPVMYNKGLKDFLTNWPDAEKEYPGLVKKLIEGKSITFYAKYKDTTYNDPLPKNVDLKDFFVRTNTEGYDGLKTTRLIAERQSYTYWELKKEERKEKFFNIDKLVQDDKDKDKKVEHYENMDFDIFECNYYFKMEEDDEEETKIKFWISEEKNVVIGCYDYPNSTIECEYVPFYIRKKKAGFYQPGMAEDLTDTNLAENLILDFTLEAAYQQNMVTPITDDEDVEAQFLEKRFTHGIPIKAKPGSIDFLQKYMRPMDTSGLIALMQYLVQIDDNVSKISSLMSGKESPVDPSAPASKTIALLQQSGIDVKEYILTILPSFNEVAYILLGLYFQMSKEGRKYTINPERVVGDNPFATIDRNELMARTNIQAQAYAFDFDKVNEKISTVGLYQMLRNEPIIARRPESVYVFLKNIIESWSPRWRNNIDKLLPPLDQFKKEQAAIAFTAVAQYITMKKQKEQTTGVPAEFKAEELLPMMNDLMAEAVTNPSPEVLKQREKDAQRAQSI